MEKRSTSELENILGSTSPSGIGEYLKENAESMLTGDRPFCVYMHEMIRKYGKTQQEVFLQADLPERFGYKLLSEEKHTRQRDYILRICYAAGMELEETQKALKLYGMAPLYAKLPRDAVLMIAFNNRKGSVLEVNALLAAHRLPTLKTSGTLE
ncbi:MAG: hypothetical protein IJC35_03450 [Oscillospiraceae bacterium]|nr:hypothetical protein [Oscillospiraceae bacterium]